MTPTLQVGDIMLVSGYPYSRRRPSLGDLAVFYRHKDGIPYVKRVIGRGGERVRISNGIAIVNDVPIDEPYVDPKQRQKDESVNYPEVTVPIGHIWVLGDNRDNSLDSRYIGFIDERHLIGKVIAILPRSLTDYQGQ